MTLKVSGFGGARGGDVTRFELESGSREEPPALSALVCGEVCELPGAREVVAPPDVCRWGCGLGAYSPNGQDCWIHWVAVVFHGAIAPGEGISRRQTTFDPGNLNWRTKAACLAARREVFFGTGPNHAKRAIAICGECSVRDDCLEFALAVPQSQDTHGIFGGMTPRGRRAIREQRRRTVAS